MRLSAVFSENFESRLVGLAIGDEFEITARARIVGAEEALVDISAAGSLDRKVIQGDLEVKLLLSHPRIVGV